MKSNIIVYRAGIAIKGSLNGLMNMKNIVIKDIVSKPSSTSRKKV